MIREDLSFMFYMPTRVIFGASSLQEVPLEASRLGVDKVVLVSDRLLAEKTDIVQRAERLLGQKLVAEFLDVPSDSSVEAVEKGYGLAKAKGAQGVVSIGGGSVIDTAKGIAILLSEGGHLRDYEGFQNLSRKAAPHIAVPTTAGTGSEVTYVAVIKDEEAKRKVLFGDYNILPDSAILDPELTTTLPRHLTAATGMDALSHAIEAIHSLQSEPIADALGLHAIRLLREAMPRCVDAPDDLIARGEQLIASCIAGAAFSNAQVGLCHAIAHTVGAHFGVHHGLANSIALPFVVMFNYETAVEKYKMIASAFGMTGEVTGKALAIALQAFARSLGLPCAFKDLGVPMDALPSLAEQTLADGAIVYNARTVTDPSEILPVWEGCFSGKIV
jgi:alcohol dehydrogenase class IV